MPVPPPTAYPAGTELVVGSHKVTITKYISEGGFAHVYTCKIKPYFRDSEIACLKRVLVPTKVQLNLLRQEVDAMKRLKDNEHIVSYIDSHASRVGTYNPTQGQQYEVFVLMEYCSRNGLIDFMNTRLTHKLTEPEILRIMYDVTIGVAMCHHLRPPLLHRDIKIENVLIDEKGTYKLCDFGSVSNYFPPPKNAQEMQFMHDDIMRNTTPQYRAPEMIDMSHGFAVDDKLDIWALGCFLYKLCYYTTPFELPSHRTMQDLERLILTSDVIIPINQKGLIFSPRLINIIKCCLRKDPRRRPTATQVLDEVCRMRGIQKIPNVIPFTVMREANKDEALPPLPKRASRLTVVDTMESKTPTKEKVDPFTTIDKSKLINTNIIPRENFEKSKTLLDLLKSAHVSSIAQKFENKPTTPSSTVDANDGTKDKRVLNNYSGTPTSSVSAIQDYVFAQLNGNELSASLEKAEPKVDTLNFLKTRELEGKSRSNLRQNTGESLKSSIKSGLRKLSTGGSASSVSAQNSGINGNKKNDLLQFKGLMEDQKKDDSRYNPITNRQNSSPLHSQVSGQPMKLSIQGRMSLLASNAADDEVHKTALGYGKYTDNDIKDSDEIAAINDEKTPSPMPLAKVRTNHKRGPPKVPATLSSKKPIQARLSSLKQKTSNINSNGKGSKKPPSKPRKPIHLKTSTGTRRDSSSSRGSLPDIDELEIQFAKRFPSQV